MRHKQIHTSNEHEPETESSAVATTFSDSVERWLLIVSDGRAVFIRIVVVVIVVVVAKRIFRVCVCSVRLRLRDLCAVRQRRYACVPECVCLRFSGSE